MPQGDELVVGMYLESCHASATFVKEVCGYKMELIMWEKPL